MTRRIAIALVVALPALGVAGLRLASGASLGTVTSQKLGAFQACVLSGYPAASTVVADTYADAGSKKKNFGGDPSVQVSGQSGSAQLAFLRFDINKCSPAIAKTAVVKKATLRLFITAQADSNRTYNAYKVVTPCNEGTACWTEAGLKDSNKPSIAGTATASVTINTGSANNNRYYEWDVTNDVKAFVAGTASNYGWEVADSAVDSSATAAKFTAKDAASGPQLPALVVVYAGG